ncbi:MAG TPA: LD-carboxypeptidase [Casimicrobiaceae bacterium]
MNDKPGIGLYAPAGFAPEPAALDRAIARLTALGHKVVVDPTCRTRWQRFAAPDAERLAGVMRMATDPRVAIAITLRGGYGWTRLLPQLDFVAIAAARKRWLGYSDFTAFQLAALAKVGMTSFSGPSTTGDFGATAPSSFTLDHCFGLLAAREYGVECALDGLPECAVDGTLWGGNLALVAHLCGTPYFPRIDGGILFLEDVGEHPYRIERTLYQLLHAGVLERQRAILLGQFTQYQLQDNDAGYDLPGVVSQLRSLIDVPVYTGLPFGHVADKLTLPVGGHCALTVARGAARLVFSRYAC